MDNAKTMFYHMPYNSVLYMRRKALYVREQQKKILIDYLNDTFWPFLNWKLKEDPISLK